MKSLMLIILILPFIAANAQYTPDDKALYDTIVKQDSIFFNAYNHCDKMLDLYASYYSDSLEFYHDHAGFSNSKKDMVDATERNICGRVRRELVPGSVEVYPVPNYGAIEVGFHRFYNKENPPNTVARDGRFVIVWKKAGEKWLISRVISMH
jgi:hypothetical protein